MVIEKNDAVHNCFTSEGWDHGRIARTRLCAILISDLISDMAEPRRRAGRIPSEVRPVGELERRRLEPNMLPNVDNIGRFAVFLDLDGTVTDIAERPDEVRVDAPTLELLKALDRACGHALAVVSGRDIEMLDRMLHPLVLAAAGVHGLQRRDSAGGLHLAAESAELQSVVDAMKEAIGDEPGVVIESKRGAVALHYRQRPELEERCRRLVESIVRRRADLETLPGKMVFEIRLQGSDKGDVIEAFLREEPFVGRTPIFAGDDVTDEVGFAIVNSRGGLSIKVGGNSTLARFRAADRHELHDWLTALARAPREERVG
jgi:trehalose 6-phosphate phosphatase